MTSTLITCANTAARPGSPSAGDTVYQEDTKQIITYDGSAWRVYDSDGTGGYALDGSNTLTAAPLFHFDSAKINGVDTSGNPSNGAAFTTAWTSKINGLKTFAQGTASKQPTWNSSGTSSEPYLSSDGGDELDLEFRNTFTGPITGPFTFIGVVARGGSGHLVLGGNSDGNTLVYPTTSTDGLFMAYSSGTDYLFYGASGADTGAHPTFASGVGNGGTAVATYDVTRLFMVVRDSTPETKLFVDGNNTNGSNVATASAEVHMDKLLNSNGYRTTGNTYELAFWDSALSTADRNTLITYVNSRYGTGRNADDSDDLARATF
tara:strand:- start:271 stop:1230 length:960 start_codon:yes stop_codon:yes gene_type:complete